MQIQLKKILLVILSVLFLSGGSLEAKPLGIEIRKKIIEFGWQNPTPEYLDKNLEMIETFVPHDGIGIDAAKIITLPDGKKVRSEFNIFTKIPFRKEWYKADVEHLKNIHARAKHLKYNFIRSAFSSFNSDFDLFDDQFWDIVCQKFSIYAWLAKEGGCTGLLVDLEDYKNLQRFSYSSNHSRQECWDKARLRGRQWMNAIAKEYPDITIFFFMSLDMFFGEGEIFRNPEDLGTSQNGLMIAFINGMYDALPDSAKIVDGMECMGYGIHNLADCYRIRSLAKERFPKLLYPENRVKYERCASIALPAYLDPYFKRDSRFQQYRKDANMTISAFFRRNYVWTVQFSDEYVWTYSEARKWFPGRYPHGWMEKAMNNQTAIPGPYMGMAIPGVEEAIDFARDPRKYACNVLKNPQKLKNLIQNPGFENVKDSGGVDQKKPAPDTVFIAKLPYWATWQGKKSNGSFSLAEGKGIGGGNALMMKGVKNGCAYQTIPIDQGGAYIIRGCAKSVKESSRMVIRWKDMQGKWNNWVFRVSAAFTEDIGNGWKRATVVIPTVPSNTGYMVVMFSGPDNDVLIDDVEVFNMFEKDFPLAPHLAGEMAKWQKNYAQQKLPQVLKDEKKSPPVPGNRVPNGNFQRRGALVTDFCLPGKVLFKPAWPCYPVRGAKPQFYAVFGKNAGYDDDSAGMIIGGSGCNTFPVTGVKSGQKYRVRAKAKVAGAGKPVLKIYWSSSRCKGPFDYKMGIPTFAFSKKTENSWMIAEGEITVPEGATKFTLLPTASGLKTGKDHILFDDLEAVLIP